ncbi:MAG: helix-turn-helix transcriptional regulator [Treponema sp.]|jgi:ribosome-binding protein aMBF1 (putative translation factor)|nr:helix-turn-helix transcriptional regulator [Treponema sp.]
MERSITEDTNKLRKTLSANIKKYRSKMGFSQEKLAELAEISDQTINDIEGCRTWVSDIAQRFDAVITNNLKNQ